MEHQQEKVYVAVGKDVQDSLCTLEWALRNWSSQPISFVILHVSRSSKDLVYTPFGKLPASAVSNEKLELYRALEQEKIDKMLSKYMAFCCKVKAEIMKIEKSEEQFHEVIVGLISRLQITKLVMGITFTKSLSWKTKSGISGTVYVNKFKLDFCQLFIVCGGKLVFLKEENEESYFEDEQGVMLADMRKKTREKGSIRGWLSKMLPENAGNYASVNSTKGSSPLAASVQGTGSLDALDKWENHIEEIENHFQYLLNSNLEENGEDDSTVPHTPQEPAETIDSNMQFHQSTNNKVEALRARIEEAQKMVEEKKNEAKAHVERRVKAEWSISLCNQRAEELVTHVKEEMAKQIELKKELETMREQLEEISGDIAESKNRLRSVKELEGELGIKLKANLSEKSRVEAQLEKAVSARAEGLREMDEMRRQRDVLRRRIEFCRERETMVPASNGLNCSYRELTAAEVTEATANHSEHTGMIHKGMLHNTIVAVQFKDSYACLSQEEFKAQMELLAQIRHPHLVAMIGACENRRCIVFEYMHRGSLQDVLFTQPHLLPWHARIRIAAEICSGLGFLHETRPRPTPHGNLKPANVLLDRNLVAKIANFRALHDCHVSHLRSDVRSLGKLFLQLLTGTEGVDPEHVKGKLELGELMGILDRTAGDWPSDIAAEFTRVGLRYAVEMDGGVEKAMGWTAVMTRELEELRGKADKAVAGESGVNEAGRTGDCGDLPSVFMCPIFQEVMKQPYVAADGFSYELEAIEAWLGSGHDTSPMTNLKLKHKSLTPNHTLRGLIDDWHCKTRT